MFGAREFAPAPGDGSTQVLAPTGMIRKLGESRSRSATAMIDHKNRMAKSKCDSRGAMHVGRVRVAGEAVENINNRTRFAGIKKTNELIAVRQIEFDPLAALAETGRWQEMTEHRLRVA